MNTLADRTFCNHVKHVLFGINMSVDFAGFKLFIVNCLYEIAGNSRNYWRSVNLEETFRQQFKD